MMRTVNIAELKNRLSYYLQQVRAGEEIVIRDRNLPVARLTPLSVVDASVEELALAGQGELRLPSEALDEEAYWRIGEQAPVTEEVGKLAADAVSREREERDDGLLGR